MNDSIMSKKQLATELMRVRRQLADLLAINPDLIATDPELKTNILDRPRPIDVTEEIKFSELFNQEDIQKLQDQFALATGVASIITKPDGTPITKPSNFCRLCNDIIRKTAKGLANCLKSDASIGRFTPSGPSIHPCLSGGLWDTGAGISVGGRHIANWLIGQVRDETQTVENMRQYAQEIGANETDVIAAYQEVPAMSLERFKQIAQALNTLANQLSDFAYQNIQQNRYISERNMAEAKAIKAAEFYLNILNKAPVLIWRSGVDAKCYWFNTTWLEFTGRDISQERGDGWTEGVHPDDFSSCLNIYMESFRAKKFFEMEYRLRRHDGEFRWIVDFGCPFETIDGEFGGYIGYCYDINERKYAENALKRSEKSLRSTLDGLSAHIALLDEQGNILLVNKAWREFAIINGINPAIVSEGANYIKTCEDSSGNNAVEAASFAEGVRMVLAGEKDSFAMEYPCHAPNEKRWFTGRVTPFPGDGHRRVIVAHENISERKLAENILRKERDFSNAVVLMAGSLVMVLDREGRIKRFNRACEVATGFTFDEINQTVFWEVFLNKNEINSFKDTFGSIVAGNFPSTHEDYLFTKVGGKRLIAWSNTTLLSDDGNVEYVIFTGSDITESREAENSSKREMHSLEKMSGPIPTTLTASSLGLKTLKESSPDLFSELVLSFAQLMEQAIEMLAVKVEYDISKEVRSISETLGSLRAGPRDATDIFLAALKKNCDGASPEKCKAYREEGRILLIELIGKLAIYFRNHCLGIPPPQGIYVNPGNGGCP